VPADQVTAAKAAFAQHWSNMPLGTILGSGSKIGSARRQRLPQKQTTAHGTRSCGGWACACLTWHWQSSWALAATYTGAGRWFVTGVLLFFNTVTCVPACFGFSAIPTCHARLYQMAG
jgi:hypothetical protein